jgi:flagellar motor switch protein FliN/FliY
MTANLILETNQQSFSNNFCNSLVGALAQATGLRWLVEAAPDTKSASDGSQPVFIQLTLDGSLRGEFVLQFHGAEAAMLASKVLRQPADEFGIEQTEALLKLVRSGMDEFCATLARQYGTFTFEASSVSELPSDRQNVAQIAAADDESNHLSILMYLNPALVEALTLHSQSGSRVVEPGSAVKFVPAEAPSEQKNLNLVMDVELNVTLRFGQRQLTLREVLELTSGSVVELDRQVDEPVELLLDGKVIARGEAVVIDGNYGLRVTEVSQRLSTSILC